MKKNIYIYVCITELPCCTAEINTFKSTILKEKENERKKKVRTKLSVIRRTLY